MNHWTTYPLVRHPCDPSFVRGDSVRQFAQAAETAGFAGIGFTDHPAPTQRWLSAGGHDALDPFAALAFVAACTTRIRLIPNIVVLPYRNPFIVAKAVATVAALSNDRFTLSVGTGYLGDEFRALGVDPDRRNQIFDEALELLSRIWSEDDIAFAGHTFQASGQTVNPKPERVPIWIGGNGQVARQRVADLGDGWNPFPAPAALARTTRTKALETVEELGVAIDDLRRRLEAARRDPSAVDVTFVTSAGGRPGDKTFNVDEHLAALDDLAGVGVNWNTVHVPGDSLPHALETLERYGEQVIARS